MSDIFDELLEESAQEEDESNFSEVLTKLEEEEKRAKANVMASKIALLVRSQVRREIHDVRKLILSEAAKLKPIETTIVKPIERVVKEIINKEIPVHIPPPPPPPPQIVKEIVKEVRIEAPKDPKKYAEEKIVESLKTQIEELKSIIEDSKAKTEMMMKMRGGSGVIGIPPPEGNPEGYVLTVKETKAKWQQSTGGGLTAGTFSISNNTPNYTFDAQNSTIDTLYQTVATLIRKLQGEI